jgi:hypothetical protein
VSGWRWPASDDIVSLIHARRAKAEAEAKKSTKEEEKKDG